MFCSKCGKKINETDNYCSLCGQVNTGNKETSKENKKRFDWKLILVVFFVLLFAKVLGSAFGPSTSYLETEVSGWTEEYESAYMNSCRKTRAQSIGVDSEIHPQVVSYCHCTLEEWKNLFPERPPSLSELERHGRIIYELCN